MKKITIWYRYNPKTENFEFNHFSSGWPSQYFPPMISNFRQQWENWTKCRWAREMAYLDGAKIKYRPDVDWK